MRGFHLPRLLRIVLVVAAAIIAFNLFTRVSVQTSQYDIGATVGIQIENPFPDFGRMVGLIGKPAGHPDSWGCFDPYRGVYVNRGARMGEGGGGRCR